MNDKQIDQIKKADLSSTMKTSFLEYAMSVIVARALPDVRDGLKPVQRRILYGMNELGLMPDKAYKKSARIVGDVMGKYHPHGDSSIYEGLVRMAQDFSYRYMLVDGHGNFGSIDGDSAAAMRYTEARMSHIAVEMLRDINKDTIDFESNYDGTEQEPVVLPSRFPNLIVNGATGIAVGMATNIPPHNLSEVISALHLLMNNPDVSVDDLMKELPGPDFPTGGLIVGSEGIKKAYLTGRGAIILRGRTEIKKQKNGKEEIVITEIPYMINKSRLVEKIAKLAREKQIDGITSLSDESDRDGMRIVIGVRHDISASIVLNNLFKMTSLQTTFNFNMVAIVDGAPKTLGLKDILTYYLKHQEEVVRRRTNYDLNKAEDRAHILRGLQIALNNIDDIIRIIKKSSSSKEAISILIQKFGLSLKQSQAILNMRLIKLTSLERNKIDDEYSSLMTAIKDYKNILSNSKRINEIIYNELLDIQNRLGDSRRTQILKNESVVLNDEDLIEDTNIVVSLTNNGYIKRSLASDFKEQRRGGHGVLGMSVHQDDFVKKMLCLTTHDTLLLLTNTGKVFKLKGYEIPEYGRNAKGIPAINLLNMEPDERIESMLYLKSNKNYSNHYLFFITKKGIVKRTSLEDFIHIRKNGLKAIIMKNDDELEKVLLTDGSKNIFIATHEGYVVSFPENSVRSMGRNASGVHGIRLRPNDYVIGADSFKPNDNILVVSENGYGKKTEGNQYSLRNRGGKGIKTLNINKKNGLLAGAITTNSDEDILIITNKGIVIRFNVNNVPKTNRVTSGVRLIRLDDNSKVMAITKMMLVK